MTFQGEDSSGHKSEGAMMQNGIQNFSNQVNASLLNELADVRADRDRLTERLATAEADNAALVKVLDDIRKKSYEPDPERPALSTRNETQLMAEGILAADHPGTALTQRLAGMTEALKKIANITDGHAIDADRRDRIYALAKQALEGKS